MIARLPGDPCGRHYYDDGVRRTAPPGRIIVVALTCPPDRVLVVAIFHEFATALEEVRKRSKSDNKVNYT